MSVDQITCPACAHRSAAGSRFCTGCGQNLEPQQYCPACNAALPLSSAFCSSCGHDLGAHTQAGRAEGTVHEGVWLRPDGEFIRRVDPEDCRTFLGSRTVLVPPGTVGLVVVDGAVQRVLPPGERTTVTLFERIANFFRDLGSSGRSERTALFLVDQRPVPVAFAVTTRATSSGRALATQVLCTFHLPRGDKARMGAFLAAVVGDRSAYAAADLHDLLRPEVSRYTTLSLERLQESERFSYAEAEQSVRDALEEAIGPRYGLAVSVTLAPVSATLSVNVCLGTGRAPRVRPCTQCAHELPAALLFCDACGQRQPTLIVPERVCAACDGTVSDSDGFCTRCGAAYTPASAAATPLFTRDGESVEVDLVFRVTGASPDFGKEAPNQALASAAAAYLRTVDFAVLSSASGFAGLAGAMQADLELALQAHGLSLSALDVLDVRSKRGQWLLGARADLARARDDLGLNREWLQQRSAELDLEALSLAQALKQQSNVRKSRLDGLANELSGGRAESALRTADALQRDQEALADRSARQGLAGEAAALDMADARRSADRDLAVRAAEREVASADRAHTRSVEDEAQAHRQRQAWGEFEHQSGLERGRLELDAERRRQAATLEAERVRLAADAAAAAQRASQAAAFEDHARRRHLDDHTADAEVARQTEKLRAMAELDRQMAAQEAERELARMAALSGLDARQALAVQAVELARSEGGAAFAQALAQLASVDAEVARREDAERHAAELRAVLEGQARATQEVLGAQLDRMTRLAEAGARANTSDAMVGSTLSAMAQVAASRAAPTPTVAAVAVPVETVPCTHCGASLRAGARFCGACGHAQGEGGAA